MLGRYSFSVDEFAAQGELQSLFQKMMAYPELRLDSKANPCDYDDRLFHSCQ